MASLLNRAVSLAVVFVLTGCASSVPSNFVYETSLRGEQGWMGAATRTASAEALLDSGVVTDPKAELLSAMPDADVEVQRWGLTYVSKNWKRYQVVLDADVRRGEIKMKCRLTSPKNLLDTPTLEELRANNGEEIQRRLTELVKACAVKQG